MKQRSERRDASSLVKDCEAYLSGRLAERTLDTTGFAPDWIWLNLLAHGAEAELISLRDAPPPRTGRPKLYESWWLRHQESWSQARSYLAVELLNVANLYGPLDTIQQEVLWPLEEEFASRSITLLNPRQCVAAVLTALEEYRRSARRPTRAR